MRRRMGRGFRAVYLSIGAVGGAAAIIGVVGAARLLNLISLQQQGKCDFVPCADAGTYHLVLVFSVIGVAGIALLTTTFIRWFASRT
jgi:hypothetical protein